MEQSEKTRPPYRRRRRVKCCLNCFWLHNRFNPACRWEKQAPVLVQDNGYCDGWHLNSDFRD